MSDMRQVATVILALAVLAMGGCASGPKVYVNPDADLSLYQRVAVLSLRNLSPEPYAGERVTRALITELMIANRFQIVEPFEYAAALSRIGGEPGADGNYDPAKLKEAATQVGATGIIAGAVSDYQIQRGSGGSDFPTVTFDVELIDVATGNVAWRASITKRGKGRFPIIGGSGTRTLGRLVQEACADLVHGLVGEAF